MTTKKLDEPFEIVGKLRGKTLPQIILLNNKDKYVVKFKNNPLGNKVLANEYVVAHLARQLGLSVPYSQVIEIPKKLMKLHPILRTNSFEQGSQFCTEYIERCIPFRMESHKNLLKGLINRRDFDKMIVFDQWISNGDRTKNNVLFQSINQNEFKLYLMDHGNCFPNGRKWTVKSLKNQPRKPVPKSVHKIYGHYYCSPDQLNAFTNTIASFPDQKIIDTIHSIPDDWQISRSEKKSLADHLIKRKEVLSSIMKNYLNRYVTD